MKSTKATNATPTMKHWKRAWMDAQKFCKGIGANLWNLTKAVNEIFDDAEFRADNGLRDDLAAADWIDSRLLHVPFGYMELRLILEHYPNRSDWEKTKIAKLRDSIRQVPSEKKPKPPAQKKPTVEEVAKERDYYASRARFLERELEATSAAPGADSRVLPRPRVSDIEATARASTRNDMQRLEYHARELQSAIDRVTSDRTALSDNAIQALATLHQAIETVLESVGQLVG